MSFFKKIKNPNAGKAQIFLALLYISVLGGLTAYALYAYWSGFHASGIDVASF